MALSAGTTGLRSFHDTNRSEWRIRCTIQVLDDRIGEHGGNRLGETLQAVDDGDQDVTEVAVLQLVHDAQPELGALGLLDPDTEDLFRPISKDTERDVDGLVTHKSPRPGS